MTPDAIILWAILFMGTGVVDIVVQGLTYLILIARDFYSHLDLVDITDF